MKAAPHPQRGTAGMGSNSTVARVADHPPRHQRTRPATLSEPIAIASFWKNRRHDAVRVTLKTYEGRDLVDVREFYPATDGTLQPTKKGISISVLRLPDLAAAINKAFAKARELGLIEAMP